MLEKQVVNVWGKQLTRVPPTNHPQKLSCRLPHGFQVRSVYSRF